MTRNLPRLLAGMLALCLSLGSNGLQAAGDVYSFAVAPQFERRVLFNIWQPIVDELEKRTGNRFQLVTSLSVSEYENEVSKGAYDFVYINPYLMPEVDSSYLPLVRDSRALHGILVVRRDSPLQRIEDLQGKRLAVPSLSALGASLLLRAELERKFAVKTVPVVANTHSSVFIHVINGLSDAGGSVQKALAEQAPNIQDSLRVLYRTQDVPSHPLAANKRVAPAVREAVRKAMLELNASEAGRVLLEKIPMQPVAASPEDYQVLRSLRLGKYLNP